MAGGTDQAAEVASRTLDKTSVPAPRKDWLLDLIHGARLDGRDFEAAKALEADAQTDHGRCLMVGRRLFFEGDLEAARRTLEAATHLEPFDLRPHLLLAQIALRTDNPGEALRLSTRVLAAEPSHREARGIALRSLQGWFGSPPEVQREALLPYSDHPVIGRVVRRMLGGAPPPGRSCRGRRTSQILG